VELLEQLLHAVVADSVTPRVPSPRLVFVVCLFGDPDAILSSV